MKAIILAGGEGTRLRPLTASLPKPMAPILGRPVLEYAIRLLKKHGFYDIGITLGYMPEAIRSYFGDGTSFGVRITYFLEDTPLGTAGSVKNTGDFIDGDFLVLCGDAITDVDLSAFLAFHRARGAEASLLLHRMDIPLEYGVVVTDDEGRITRFLEKPSWGRVLSDTVNTGIYLLNPSVLSLSDKLPLDFSKDLFPRLLETGRALYGYTADGFWCDIGDLDAYRHAQYDILAGKTNIPIEGCRLEKGVYAEEGAKLERGAHISPPVFLGKNAHVKSGAHIEAFTSVGDGCVIEEGASVKRSILFGGVSISRNAQIRGSIVCAHAHVGEGASLYEQSVIGEGSRIGSGAVVRPGVRVWPGKAVGEGEIVSESLVWGHAALPDLFTERGLVGHIGTDLTPAASARAGGAFGTLLGGRCGLSSDGTPAAHMLREGVLAGLLSVGCEVFDFGTLSLPAARFSTETYALSGAIHVATEGGEGVLVCMGKCGIALSESEARRLHTLYLREDFAPTTPDNMKKPQKIEDFTSVYLHHILKDTVSLKGLRILVSAPPLTRPILEEAARRKGFSVVFEEAPRAGEARTAFMQKTAREGFAFGAIFDALSESFTLFDGRGRMLSSDMRDAVFALLVMRRFENAHIFVRASASSVFEEMARALGAHVSRTEDSPASLSAALSARGDFSSEVQHVLSFDAVGASILLLDFLARENRPLAAIGDMVPPFSTRRRTVACAQNQKGRIMRAFSPISVGGDEGGARIREENGWVFIIPDGERAACRIVAHAASEEYAAELAALYEEKVKSILEEKGL